MSASEVFLRAHTYAFLAQAFLYPSQDWTDELPEVAASLGSRPPEKARPRSGQGLEALQSEHRRAFGLTGSLAYETECGLPNEFRQSQELADIAGFYRAFGLRMGGKVRERPDHIAAELEFLSVLALKEACAIEAGVVDALEVCLSAQRKFLQDHLGRWAGLLARGLGQTVPESPYAELASLASSFVESEAKRLGVVLEPSDPAGVRPTPSPANWDCEGCPVVTPAEE